MILQDFFEKKNCQDAETKFGMMELLLGGQCKKDFKIFKNTLTGDLVASDGTISIATPRKITEDSFKMLLEKFKNQAFKDFVARHQVHLWQNLFKPVGVTMGNAQEDSRKTVTIWSIFQDCI